MTVGESADIEGKLVISPGISAVPSENQGFRVNKKPRITGLNGSRKEKRDTFCISANDNCVRE